MNTPTLRRVTAALLALCTGLAGVLILSTSAAAGKGSTEQDQLLITFDVSGSMDKDDGTGKTKIQAAKDSLKSAVGAIDDDAQVGLRTYGGSCTRTDLEVPIDTIDKKAMRSAIGSQSADGDTPIAHTLEKAAEDFTTDGRRSILLVSDGEETCDGDPVAVAKKLADSGINLCIDVIGFKVNDTARDQLIDIANAACGQYVDAEDGAELNSRLQRTSVRALRPYRSDGTPVTGSPDGLNAPVIEPGTYADTMPPNTESTTPSRWYAIDLPKGSRIHATATIGTTVPFNSRKRIEIASKLYTDENERCDSDDSGYYTGGGSVIRHSYISYSVNNVNAEPGECGAAGRYLLEVNNDRDKARSSDVPLEITIVVEPATTNANDLPTTEKESGDVTAPDTQDTTATSVVGSGSFSTAPILTEEGLYKDTLRPGEHVLYRVPVEYGQRLSARVKLPRLSAENEDKLGSAWAYTTVYSPARASVSEDGSNTKEYYKGDPETLTASTVPVRYNNIKSDSNTVQRTTLPGFYYIRVYLDEDVKDPYFELPITMEFEVTGDVSGLPDFSGDLESPEKQLEVVGYNADGSEEKASSKSDDSGNILLWVGIVAGAVLFSGGVTGLLLVLRSARRA